MKKHLNLLNKYFEKIAVPMAGMFNFTDKNIDIPNDYVTEKHKYMIPQRREEWIKSLSALPHNVILISFDPEKLNEEQLYKFSYIFGHTTGKYEDIADKSNILKLDANNAYLYGDREKLKEVFPDLYKNIYKLLNEKEISESEAIYMFYNESYKRTRPGFSKNPFYFGHDLGHADFDTIDADGLFHHQLMQIFEELTKFYHPEDPEDSYGIIIDPNISLYERMDLEQYGQDYIHELCDMFFDNLPSGSDDKVADVYAKVLSGDQIINSNVPREIYFKDEDWMIHPDKINEANVVYQKFDTMFEKYISMGGDSIFDSLKGQVILNDMI